MQELLRKIESAEPDDLACGTQPPLRVGGAVLKANAGALKRGTILAKGADGKLDILGNDETAEAYGILTDDTPESAEDLPVEIYISGMFNLNKLIAKEGYDITEKDKDTLRKYGIEYKAAFGF